MKPKIGDEILFDYCMRRGSGIVRDEFPNIEGLYAIEVLHSEGLRASPLHTCSGKVPSGSGWNVRLDGITRCDAAAARTENIIVAEYLAITNLPRPK